MCLLGGHGLLPRTLWVELALAWPLTLLIAWASWRFVENPVLRWAHRRGGGRRPTRRRQAGDVSGRDLAQPAPAIAAAKQA
jgi:peptidoglycan/LPS O-acetylase OafA/YrhL